MVKMHSSSNNVKVYGEVEKGPNEKVDLNRKQTSISSGDIKENDNEDDDDLKEF